MVILWLEYEILRLEIPGRVLLFWFQTVDKFVPSMSLGCVNGNLAKGSGGCFC